MTTLDLPYFDRIHEWLEREPDSTVSEAFGRNVHWGCYTDPERADDSIAGYVAATEELNRRICEVAGIADGLAILDVGCGLGGAVEYVNDRVSGCRLVGIDNGRRQIERAQQLELRENGNGVTFLEGDACDLPFADAEFDVVLAIECVFHFPSRKRFFQEAKRTLVPGGKLVLSDFVLDAERQAELPAWLARNQASERLFYGSALPLVTSEGYRRRARAAGFDLAVDDDITVNTLPTYRVLKRIREDLGFGSQPSSLIEAMTLDGILGYHVLGFTAQGV